MDNNYFGLHKNFVGINNEYVLKRKNDAQEKSVLDSEPKTEDEEAAAKEESAQDTKENPLMVFLTNRASAKKLEIADIVINGKVANFSNTINSGINPAFINPVVLSGTTTNSVQSGTKKAADMPVVQSSLEARQLDNYVWPQAEAEVDSNDLIELYPDSFAEFVQEKEYFTNIGFSYNGSSMSINITDEQLMALILMGDDWSEYHKYCNENGIYLCDDFGSDADRYRAFKNMAGIEATDSIEEAKNKLIALFSKYGGNVTDNGSTVLSMENIDTAAFFKDFAQNVNGGFPTHIDEEFGDWQLDRLATEAFLKNSGVADEIMNSKEFDEYIASLFENNPYHYSEITLDDWFINKILSYINGDYEAQGGHVDKNSYEYLLAKMANLSEEDTIEEARQKVLTLLQNYALDSNGVQEEDNNTYTNIDFVAFYKDLMASSDTFKSKVLKDYMSANNIDLIDGATLWPRSNPNFEKDDIINSIKNGSYVEKAVCIAIAYAAGVTDAELTNGDYDAIDKKITAFLQKTFNASYYTDYNVSMFEVINYLFQNGLEGPIIDYLRDSRE